MVLIDLFHAVQRTVKCIPKKHPFAYRCCQDFRMVFRQPCDFGEERSLPTPAPNVMESNLNGFIEKWKGVCFDDSPVLPTKAL